MEGTKIGNGCKIYSSILGWNCQIGNNVCIGYSVLGEGITVKNQLLVLESKVPKDEKEKNNKLVEADTSPSHSAFLAECESSLASLFGNKSLVDCVMSYVAAVDQAKLGAFDYPVSQKFIISALDRKTKKKKKGKPQKTRNKKHQKKRDFSPASPTPSPPSAPTSPAPFPELVLLFKKWILGSILIRIT